MGYEHFRKLVLETDEYLYYINSLGYFERIDKATIDNGFANTGNYVFEKLAKIVQHGRSKTPILVSIINGKQYSIKASVVRFIKNIDLQEDEAIVHIDNNYQNCNIENLVIIKKALLVNKKWDQWELNFNGKLIKCESTAQLCKRLGISYWTLRDYLKGRYTKNHWLNDYTIRRVR